MGGLTEELASLFVKATYDKTETKKDTIVYGTAVRQNGKLYVQLDGSDILTPVESTANAVAGDRVTVMIKNHTATITGNLSSPSARSEDVDKINTDISKISEFEILIAGKVSTEELEVESGRIDDLITENITIKQNLAAQSANIDNLQTDTATITEKLAANEAEIDRLQTAKLDASTAEITYATIENLDSTNANVRDLSATYGEFVILSSSKFESIEAAIEQLEAGEITVEQLKSTFATIAKLDTERARIDSLESEVGDIDTLIFGSATGSTIQTSFANAVIAQLGNAQIKSAMIDSLSADKITSGDVVTNNVRVVSEDGKLLISDETIQISDGTRVRVQIGKDAANDYSINIWDASGNLMFSKGGITESAIKNAIIRNDMVRDDANIAAHKLDIDSLFEEINGSSKTIKSSKVLFDDREQTLDVAFESLTTDVEGLQNDVSSQGTAISVIQGNISSKIWQQDIDAVASAMSDQYASVEQNLDSLSGTVAKHTTQIASKADDTKVTEIGNKVGNLELSLEQFEVSVGETYVTKTEAEEIDSNVSAVETRITSAESEIRLNKESVETLVSHIADDYYTKEETSSVIQQQADIISSSVSAVQTNLDNLTIGGRNLIATSYLSEATWGINFSGTSTKEFTASAWVGTAITTDRLKEILTVGETYTLYCDIEIVELPDYADNGFYDSNVALYFYSPTVSGNNLMINAKLIEGDRGTLGAKYVLHRTFVCPEIHDDTNLVMYTCLYRSASGGPGNTTTVKVTNLKLEKGDKATDWTPSPEDNALVDDVTTVRAAIEATEERMISAESVIQQLASAFSMLITDENGETLMTQTDNGWTYNIAQIQNTLSSTSEALNDLINTVGDVDTAVAILQQSMKDIGAKTDYVQITTYESEPCIELGESDSDFKLMMTNTRIMFKEGNSVLAYFTNQAFHTEKAVIKEELQQGGFVWKARSNGNLALMWKGEDE